MKKTRWQMGLLGIMIMCWLVGWASPGACAQPSSPDPAKTPAAAAGKEPAPAQAGLSDKTALTASPGAGAAPGAPPAAPAASASLTLRLLPDQVAPGDTLVISSNQDGTFDQNAGSNEVTFPLAKDHKKESAREVSWDGRTIVVPVPEQAHTGDIAIRNKRAGKDYGNLTLTINRAAVKTGICGNWLLIPGIFYLVIFLVVALAVKKGFGDWNLSGALSEHMPTKVETTTDAQTNKTITTTIYTPFSSSSRLIAFLGFLTIIFWSTAILFPGLYWFSRTGEVPDLSNISNFLWAQAAIFAPYIAGKIADAIGKPSQPAPPPSQPPKPA